MNVTVLAPLNATSERTGRIGARDGSIPERSRCARHDTTRHRLGVSIASRGRGFAARVEGGRAAPFSAPAAAGPRAGHPARVPRRLHSQRRLQRRSASCRARSPLARATGSRSRRSPGPQQTDRTADRSAAEVCRPFSPTPIPRNAAARNSAVPTPTTVPPKPTAVGARAQSNAPPENPRRDRG